MTLERTTHESRSPWRGSSGVVASLADLVDMRLVARRLDDPQAASFSCVPTGPYHATAVERAPEGDEERLRPCAGELHKLGWRSTARTGRPRSDVARGEEENSTWIYTDLGPSMRFGTRSVLKSVAAARAAALLAWSARRAGHRIGALIHAPSGARVFHPRVGDDSLFQILAAMARGTADPGTTPAETLAECLTRLCETMHSNSRIVLVSDFSGLDEHGRRLLARLARRTALTCVVVFDPAELESTGSGRCRIGGGGEVLRIDAEDDRWRRAYCEHFLARFHALDRFCRKHRIELIPLQTDEDPGQVLAPMLAPAAVTQRDAV